MAGITVYEFGVLAAASTGAAPSHATDGLRTVPPDVFIWLEAQALRSAEAGESTRGAAWARLTQQRGRRAVQVTSFVGVIRAPNGYQIEVLPKLGKAVEGGDGEARQRLIEMLHCLGGFRHIQVEHAQLLARRMPLLEVFIGEFLRSVADIVKRGLRGDYSLNLDNLYTLRGKLQVAAHLRQNICRRDRFFAAFDEFSTHRAENRLLHTALRRVLAWTASQTHQQLARELSFVFADVPVSDQPAQDFQRVRLDRGMGHYADALAWARLILLDESPLTGAGGHPAPSLLFPMEAVFEAFVAKHLARQLALPYTLKTQARSFSLVTHLGQDWFRLKPDLLVQASGTNHLVLDTKWKLLDTNKAKGADKYGLDQGDFYQLHAYGQRYLDGQGDVVLIYPQTDAFHAALHAFEFTKPAGLQLWVLPFSLKDKRLLLPPCGSLDALFARRDSLLVSGRDAADVAPQEAVLA